MLNNKRFLKNFASMNYDGTTYAPIQLQSDQSISKFLLNIQWSGRIFLNRSTFENHEINVTITELIGSGWINREWELKFSIGYIRSPKVGNKIDENRKYLLFLLSTFEIWVDKRVAPRNLPFYSIDCLSF